MILLMKIIGLDTDCTPDLFLLIIIGIVALAVVVGIGYIIASCITHTCTYCHNNQTTDTDNDENYQCQSCKEALLIKDAKRKEKIRKCPDCNKDMDKQVIDGTDIVADVCTSCGGVFLDKGELEEIAEQLEIEEITFSPATTVAIMTTISH